MHRLPTPWRRTQTQSTDGLTRAHQREQSDQAAVDDAKLQMMTWFSAR